MVAFDQEYLQNVLTVQNKSNLNFIDKIFQVVFHLPQVDINSLQKELSELITEKIIKDGKAKIDHLKPILNITITSYKHLIFKILDTPRDIVRFSNQIVVHYRFIENCDYSFSDFFILELIRYRFPLIINELIYRPEFFLSEEETRYVLRPKFVKHLKEYYEKEVEQNQIISTHLVSQEDELLLLKLLGKLFGDNHKDKSKDTINIKTNYYRYFSMTIFDNDLLYNEFKQAVYSTEYEKNLLELVKDKSRARILHLFDQLIGDSFESKDKLIKLINGSRIYNDSFELKDVLLPEFYTFLKKIINENIISKKSNMTELEEIILFCIRSKHDAESDLKHLFNISKRLHDSDSVSEIGISFKNLNLLKQELFNEIITSKNCSLDDAYNSWIFTKYSPESDKTPQPSTNKLRTFILEKFKTDFIERFYSVLDAPRGFETYVNLQLIFPTKLDEKNTSEFLENLAITIQIIKKHYQGATDISTFLKNSIIPEMQKLRLSKSEQINQFSEIVLHLDLPSELKDEVRETFKNSIN